MSIERKERIQEIRDGDYARRRRVVEYMPETRQVLVSRISKLLWLITLIVTSIIAFRFILKLLAANAANGFVNLIYDITDVFVRPFIGILESPTFESGAVIDTGSLFAIVVYVLLTWAIVALFRIVFAGTKHSRHTTTIERQQ